MLSYVKIDQLEVETLVGIHSKEREALQKLLVDLKIAVKDQDPKDRIENVLDYEKLIEQIRRHLKNQNFYLLETVARFIARLVLDHQLVLEVRVGVFKPQLLCSNKLGVEIVCSS